MYLRVSTGEQTLEPQRAELLEYCRSKGWPEPTEYSDVLSGAKQERAGLDALIAAVREHQIRAVLVVKVDRLARSLTHFLQLTSELRKHEVALIVPGQGIDTSSMNPCGQLLVNLLSVIAEFERSLIVERTKAGLRSAKAQGKKLGRPSPVMVANPQEVVAQWKAETGGFGIKDLARRLGGVSTSTAWKLGHEA
jgi:DNA invertase Pin-like site-specific DNA recombinase